MAKIVSRGLRWPVMADPKDLTKYKVYYATAPRTFDYTEPFVDVGIPAPAGGFHVIRFADYPAIMALAEGNYDFGVTAVDDAGNESDFSEAENVPLDVTALPAPGPIEVVEG